MNEAPILHAEDLTVTFPSRGGPLRVVDNVSFSLGQEKLGIVGESGSGKSMTARALLGLVPLPGQVTAQRIHYRAQDLQALSPAAYRALRGTKLSMILQDPKFSLNPVQRVGHQIAESFRLHDRASRKEAKEQALDMLARVRIAHPARVFHQYPHEISGGMGQRVMIAMMLATKPDVLIADEPTSALDVTVRRQILDVLDALIADNNTALIFISHDLNLVAQFCDRVLVMYRGRIVETLPAHALHASQHPYTRGLVESLPQLDDRRRRLPTLDRARL